LFTAELVNPVGSHVESVGPIETVTPFLNHNLRKNERIGKGSKGGGAWQATICCFSMVPAGSTCYTVQALASLIPLPPIFSCSTKQLTHTTPETKMDNNELLRSIRDALKLDEATMIRIFKEAGREFGPSTVASFLKTKDEDNYIPCADPVLGFFLDGLIVHNRGRQEGRAPEAAKPAIELGNNAILKKLRIALDLKEEDLVEILTAGGVAISKHEITALFRKQGHKHYQECDDRLLQSFLKGVALNRMAPGA
jgi:uncharacterized protein YehS (DUF1456 family)